MANAHLYEHDAFALKHGAGACYGYEVSTAPVPAFQPGRIHKARDVDGAEGVTVFKQAVGARIGGADWPAVAPSSREDDRWLRCQFNPACPD